MSKVPDKILKIQCFLTPKMYWVKGRKASTFKICTLKLTYASLQYARRASRLDICYSSNHANWVLQNVAILVDSSICLLYHFPWLINMGIAKLDKSLSSKTKICWLLTPTHLEMLFLRALTKMAIERFNTDVELGRILSWIRVIKSVLLEIKTVSLSLKKFKWMHKVCQIKM